MEWVYILLIKIGGNMPNRDGTGPTGKGPKTGRGLGNCQGETKNTDNRPLNKRLGRGRGLGFGRNRNVQA